MSLNNTTSKGKDQNTHLRTAGVVQACHNFLISQTGSNNLDSGLQWLDSGFHYLDSGFQSRGFRIPQTKITWILDSGLPYMGRFHQHLKSPS